MWTSSRKAGGISSVSTRFSLSVEIERGDAGRKPNPSRETKFSAANGDREKNIIPVQLTTSRIGNHTRLTRMILCWEC